MNAPVRIKPIVFTWSGNEMVPMPRFKPQADRQYLIGEEYVLSVVEPRSRASHNHYFASIHEAWENLPERVAHRFPSPEALRAKALVETGWCVEKNMVCDTPDHAMQLAANIRGWSAFTVIRVQGNVVQAFDPMSQSAMAMGKDAFEESKRAVLEWIAGLIETKVSTLKKRGAETFPEPKRSAR